LAVVALAFVFLNAIALLSIILAMIAWVSIKIVAGVHERYSLRVDVEVMVLIITVVPFFALSLIEHFSRYPIKKLFRIFIIN
jgi:hypothetical protein